MNFVEKFRKRMNTRYTPVQKKHKSIVKKSIAEKTQTLTNQKTDFNLRYTKEWDLRERRELVPKLRVVINDVQSRFFKFFQSKNH